MIKLSQESRELLERCRVCEASGSSVICVEILAAGCESIEAGSSEV